LATFTGQLISATYDAILKSIDNDPLGSVAKQITDGLGNVTPLYISTTQIGIGITPTEALHVSGNIIGTGTLNITGLTTFGTLKSNLATGATIGEFITEAQGIASNNNDTTLPTSAAVKNYVDSANTGQVTGSGTGGKLPIWTGVGASTTLSDSSITEESTRFVLTKDIFINDVLPVITLSDSNSSGSATSGDIVWIDSAASQRAIISLTSNTLGITSKQGGLAFNTASTPAMSIDASQNAIFNSDLDVTGDLAVNTDKFTVSAATGAAFFTGLVSGITPTAAANFTTKSYVDGLTPNLGLFLRLAGGTMSGELDMGGNSITDINELTFGANAYITSPSNTLVRFNQTSVDIASGDLTVSGTISGVLANGVTATTQTANNNSTKVATTAYVDTSAGLYLPLTGGTLIGALIGTTATFAGNVGIGADSPGNRLVVRGPSSDATGGDNNVAQFEGPSGTNGFQVYVNDTLNNTGIQTKNGDSFIINPGGGNVGIGTTGPNSKLQVDGSIRAENSAFLAGREDAAAPAHSFHDDADTGMFNINPNILGFSTAGTEKMRIDSSGLTTIKRTGITGAAKADMNLHLGFEGNDGENNLIGFGYNGGTNIPAYIGYSSTSGSGNTKGDLYFATRSVTTDTQPSNRMVVKANGNVGIGTNATVGQTPGSLLTLSGNSNNFATAPIIRFDSTSTTTNVRNWAIGPADTAIGNFHIMRSATLGGDPLTGAGAATFTIDYTGNVGIGTVSPAKKLDVEGNIRAKNTAGSAAAEIDISSGATWRLRSNPTSGTNSYGLDIIQGGSGTGVVMSIFSNGIVKIGGTDTGYSGTLLHTGSYSATQSGINILSSNTGYGYLLFGDGDGAASYTGQITYKHGDEFMAFNTNSVERMRISSGGKLLIGKTELDISISDGFRFDPNGEAFASIPSTGANTWHVYDMTNNAYRFYVSAAGQIYATSTSISGLSDITLKENIKPLETGLDDVMKLKPKRFDWKNGDGKNIAGFIAQEVEQVLPDLVSESKYTDEETKKSLKMGDMIPTLVKAIQELTAKVERLEQECKCK